MIRSALLVIALTASLLLSGCTGDRNGVLDDIMDPTDPSITVTLPSVTTLVPATDAP